MIPHLLPSGAFEIGPLHFTPSEVDAILRLVAAMAAGMAVGLNRDLHGKPTGVRTLGLVALGAALVSLAALGVEGIAGHPDATSRVVQGILQGVLTGIGFLGAGVLMRHPDRMRVHGLTTAASVWVTAGLGITCALASWHLVIAGVALTLFLLAVVRPLERAAERRRARTQEGGAGEKPPFPPPPLSGT